MIDHLEIESTVIHRDSPEGSGQLEREQEKGKIKFYLMFSLMYSCTYLLSITYISVKARQKKSKVKEIVGEEEEDEDGSKKKKVR